MQYSEHHDTGDDSPCTLGYCCRVPREQEQARAVLAQYRSDPPDSIQEDAFLAALIGNEATPAPVLEILHLLDQPWEYLTMGDFCLIAGIPYARLMKYRTQFSDLEEVCRLYLGGLAEDEFASGRRKMPATVLGMGLERLVPAFAKVADESLTAEDIMVIVRTVVDGIKAHVTALDLPEAREHAFIQGVTATLVAAFALRVKE